MELHRTRRRRTIAHAAVANVAEIAADIGDAALVLLVSLRNDYAGEWQRYVAGEVLAIELPRNRFPYIAQGRAIEVHGIQILVATNTQPTPTDLSPQQVGLVTLPSFEPTQQDAIQLTFVVDEDLLPRSGSINAFLLLSYTVQ